MDTECRLPLPELDCGCGVCLTILGEAAQLRLARDDLQDEGFVTGVGAQ